MAKYDKRNRIPETRLRFVSKANAQIDASVAKEILRKMKNHLWYLSPESMGLSFFDLAISIEEKRKMMQHLEIDQQVLELIHDKKFLQPENLLLYCISDFVTSRTNNFFYRFEISLNFIK